MRELKPAHERVLALVKTEGDCWIFQGSKTTNGYGRISVGRASERRLVRAHRVTYEHFKGPIPHGLTVDHLCFNKTCVNPDHLEAVSLEENVRRQMAAGRSIMPYRA